MQYGNLSTLCRGEREDRWRGTAKRVPPVPYQRADSKQFDLSEVFDAVQYPGTHRECYVPVFETPEKRALHYASAVFFKISDEGTDRDG
jgi:hypothetical protein